ncbi:MAG TPA: autotransporter-associated beta strand repeat-containing protein, partial [Candidatus Sulfotelmatobacter sp.]|nr:autotransporter-associated beta strand repeat-containing protein [Candidatus Sulfotelmatobacter sp.]
MKTQNPSILTWCGVHFSKIFFAAALLIGPATLASTLSIPLYWDAGNTNNGATIDAGSGTWDTVATNVVWNDGSGNQTNWQQFSTTVSGYQAIFNGVDGAAGAYQVNVDAGQVAVSNLFVNASGYLFYGSPIYISSQGAGNYPSMRIADGKSATFSNLINGLNYKVEILGGANGAPATESFADGLAGSQWSFSSTNGSTFSIGANTSFRGFFTVNASVIMTNGVLTESAANGNGVFEIGRQSWFTSQPGSLAGSFTLDGPTTTLNQFGGQDFIMIGRAGVSAAPFTSSLTVQNGATLIDQISTANNGIAIPQIGSGGPGQISIFNVYGGTATLGAVTGGNTTNGPILLQVGGSWPSQVSLVNQTGGVINAWTGIQFGGTGANRTGGSAIVTNSGGFLYLGSSSGLDALRSGTTVGGSLPPTNIISFSGGTVGALQSWSGSAALPITLGTLNGNITFQSADASATPHDITLNGALTGAGGFNKTGAGQLILNAVNTYTGSTVVSNGVLQLTTALAASSNGPVTLDGSAGSPDLRLVVSHQGQYWSAGTMTFAAGSPTLDFQYGLIVPSK